MSARPASEYPTVGHVMQFGLYLQQRGLITAEQFIRALKLQQRERQPLGLIAVEEGLLTPPDLLRILQRQTDLTNDRLGDVAIELGILTRRDVAMLLMLQSDRELPFSECLVRLGILTPEQVGAYLNDYRQEREHAAFPKVQHVASTPANSAPMGLGDKPQWEQG